MTEGTPQHAFKTCIASFTTDLSDGLLSSRPLVSEIDQCRNYVPVDPPGWPSGLFWRTVWDQLVELLLELENHPLSRLLSNPRNRSQANQIPRQNGLSQLIRRESGQNDDSQLGADAGNLNQQDKQVFLTPGQEPVKTQIIFFYMSVDSKRDFVSHLAQFIVGRTGNENFIADPPNVNDELSGRFLIEGSRQSSQHGFDYSEGGRRVLGAGSPLVALAPFCARETDHQLNQALKTGCVGLCFVLAPKCDQLSAVSPQS